MIVAAELDRWVLRRPGPPGAVPVLCLPYAGAGTAVYRGWDELLAPVGRPWLVRLPGRETRIREACGTDLRELARQLAAALAPHLRPPYALVGHSMGALLAFETAHELTDAYGLPPGRLVVSARPAPHLPGELPPIAGMPDEEFVAALDSRYGGVPAAMRADPDFLRLFLPVLRADVTALETYRPAVRPPLACPIAAVRPRADHTVRPADLLAWREHTSGGLTPYEVAGGHFYLTADRGVLPAVVVAELAAQDVAW